MEEQQQTYPHPYWVMSLIKEERNLQTREEYSPYILPINAFIFDDTRQGRLARNQCVHLDYSLLIKRCKKKNRRGGRPTYTSPFYRKEIEHISDHEFLCPIGGRFIEYII